MMAALATRQLFVGAGAWRCRRSASAVAPNSKTTTFDCKLKAKNDHLFLTGYVTVFTALKFMANDGVHFECRQHNRRDAIANVVIDW